jgi:hypothetical protein
VTFSIEIDINHINDEGRAGHVSESMNLGNLKYEVYVYSPDTFATNIILKTY